MVDALETQEDVSLESLAIGKESELSKAMQLSRVGQPVCHSDTSTKHYLCGALARATDTSAFSRSSKAFSAIQGIKPSLSLKSKEQWIASGQKYFCSQSLLDGVCWAGVLVLIMKREARLEHDSQISEFVDRNSSLPPAYVLFFITSLLKNVVILAVILAPK